MDDSRRGQEGGAVQMTLKLPMCERGELEFRFPAGMTCADFDAFIQIVQILKRRHAVDGQPGPATSS